ncbi:hypothetical protein POX_b02569 [Penicillium oxalicum]|uniref:hypothetical protein n=1 Tax=Penicillium oxalicum TaxID=69781 RepID=UPI0020B7C37F|nr:hypothetical protein POX_b02569 [Penicillium oxalicum]KAI2792531.1 hypothetical protein POX_b02569 [Penicillium oxalicum]
MCILLHGVILVPLDGLKLLLLPLALHRGLNESPDFESLSQRSSLFSPTAYLRFWASREFKHTGCPCTMSPWPDDTVFVSLPHESEGVFPAAPTLEAVFDLVHQL